MFNIENLIKIFRNKNKDKKILLKIPKALTKELNKYKSTDLGINNKNVNNVDGTINKIYNDEILDKIKSSYITDKIKDKILNLKNQKVITYNLNIDNILTNIEINLYYNKISSKKIEEIIDTLNFGINFYQKNMDNINNNPKKIDINIFYCNIKKTLKYKSKNQFKKENINSAFTNFSSNKDNYIVIYRQEELNKVLLHELKHYYDNNFSSLIDKAISKDLSKLTNLMKINNISNKNNNTKNSKVIEKINYFTILNEAYVETIATILYTYHYTNKNNKDFEDLITQQYIFSLFQSAKILLNQNIDKLEYPIILNSYNENSIGYHFIKSSLLRNISKIDILNIDLDDISLIIKSITNKDFINDINSNIDILNNDINKNIKDKNIVNTFRMNILD